MLTTKRVKGIILQARAGPGGSAYDVIMEVMMVTGYDQGEGGDVNCDTGKVWAWWL